MLEAAINDADAMELEAMTTLCRGYFTVFAKSTKKMESLLQVITGLQRDAVTKERAKLQTWAVAPSREAAGAPEVRPQLGLWTSREHVGERPGDSPLIGSRSEQRDGDEDRGVLIGSRVQLTPNARPPTSPSRRLTQSGGWDMDSSGSSPPAPTPAVLAGGAPVPTDTTPRIGRRREGTIFQTGPPSWLLPEYRYSCRLEKAKGAELLLIVNTKEGTLAVSGVKKTIAKFKKLVRTFSHRRPILMQSSPQSRGTSAKSLSSGRAVQSWTATPSKATPYSKISCRCCFSSAAWPAPVQRCPRRPCSCASL